MQVIYTKKLQQLIVGIMIVMASLVGATSQASHIIGGEVSMKAIGTTPGLFRLQLNQYWDETKTNLINRDPFVKLLIYSKKNPALIESVTLNLQETKPLTFDNEACAKLRQLSFTQALYYENYQFDPARYTDPDGYYAVWERCCRNDGLTNVNSALPAGVAMTFYFEFPPMMKNGKAFANSSPDFRLPNGDYICINKPFTFDAGATDADGDQLRFSLVTPLNGYTTRNVPTSTDTSPRSSYPTIVWGSGYSLTNIIPGNPPLSINQTTGQLSVRASAEGLYLFTVQCEEFRNGVRIGVIRRDFQLPVIDCAKTTPQPAVITVNGTPDSSVVWCASQPLVLAVEKNPIWAYQWQKDGKNIAGSTADTIHVFQSGHYTVVKSQANVCSNDTASQSVNVLIGGVPVDVSATTMQPYCAGDTITLKADIQVKSQYSWFRDGNAIAGAQQATLRVAQSGNYMVRTSQPSIACVGKDSISVTINPRPSGQINAPVKALCQGDSVLLTVNQSSGYRYRWQQNEANLIDTTSRLVALQAGTYQVRLTAPTGCTANTDPVTLTQNSQPSVQMDSIPPTCGSSTTPVALHGQPAGGTYSGDGVTGDQFDPVAAGVGQHQLSYTVTSNKGCRATQTRVAVVSPGPTLTGSTKYVIIKGTHVQLTTQSSEPISRYQWEPPTYLSQTDVASPIANPTEAITYQLIATSASGCSSTLSVTVETVQPLYMPSAFSPNGDGRNDSWEISNINLFPQCSVSIYDRWGELVFHSKGYSQPWDGTYHAVKVDPGTYTYQIQTNDPVLPVNYQGQLTVMY